VRLAGDMIDSLDRGPCHYIMPQTILSACAGVNERAYHDVHNRHHRHKSVKRTKLRLELSRQCEGS
jgi:hypothetical protein